MSATTRASNAAMRRPATELPELRAIVRRNAWAVRPSAGVCHIMLSYAIRREAKIAYKAQISSCAGASDLAAAGDVTEVVRFLLALGTSILSMYEMANDGDKKGSAPSCTSAKTHLHSAVPGAGRRCTQDLSRTGTVPDMTEYQELKAEGQFERWLSFIIASAAR